MATASLQALKYVDGGDQARFDLLDQRKLPLQTEYLEIKDIKEAWVAIKDMAVRGAPAIAIAGALALAVELQNGGAGSQFSSAQEATRWIDEKLDYLITSRPTAVNLSDAATKLKNVATQQAAKSGATTKSVVQKVIQAAKEMQKEDIESNQAMGAIGADAIWQEITKGQITPEKQKLRMLTHCNTGSLATAGFGTALGVIRTLHARGLIEHVYCTETRPYNQGARLTAYELVHDGLPATLVADSAAAALMEAGKVDAIVVGADRVTSNGDTANKIGTYSLAVIASHHKVPFYIAAPRTTLDASLRTGREIKIEERDPSELTHHQGKQVAAPGIQVWNPSFDVTPAFLITGIITEAGMVPRSTATAFDVPAILRDNANSTAGAESESTIPGFQALNLDSVKTYLAERPALCDRLGEKEYTDKWQVREVGDGNINYVYIVEGPRGAVVVKQGLPYIRIDHSWKLTQERARIEANALAEEHKHCPDHVPTLYHFDPQMSLLVMQYLAPPHDILRRALVAGRIFPKLSTHVASFLARTLFNTSLLNLGAETYRENLVKFQNTDLCKLTEQVIFTDPYYAAPVNRHTSPQLDAWAEFLRSDSPAKAAAASLKAKFMERQQALLHGDLHTGSFMVTEDTTYAIDAEFAFYGPIAFDVCKMIANLLIAYFASFGLEQESKDSRKAQQEWILQSIKEIWEKFCGEFRNLVEDAVRHGKGGELLNSNFYPASALDKDSDQVERWQASFESELLRDTQQFAGAVIIRRIFGIAHVIDFESIQDPDLRSKCEKKAVLMGYLLLTAPSGKFEDVIKRAEEYQSMDLNSIGGPSEQIRAGVKFIDSKN